MSDSIKFGPEWLRNSMSNDGLSSSTGLGAVGGGLSAYSNSRKYNFIHSASLFVCLFCVFFLFGQVHFKLTILFFDAETRFPLAEYRYGREEMLSLYDKNFKLPELLPKFNKLFIEKMQCPLALLPPSADEEAVIIICSFIFK